VLPSEVKAVAPLPFSVLVSVLRKPFAALAE
jgi:hypothetical protein